MAEQAPSERERERERQREQHARAEDAFADLLDRTRPAAPRWTRLLLAANVAMFALLLAAGAGWDGGNMRPFLHYGAIHRGLIAQGEYWRLLAAAFLHFGIIHLALNMWALWDVGSLCERLFGPVGYLLVYAASAATGGAASILVHGDAAVSAGASGAIFGLCGALGALMLRHQRAFPPRVLKRLAASVGGMIAYTLFLGFTKDGIDNAAHIGGLLAGFALGLPLAEAVDRPLPARPFGRWSLAALGAVLMIGGLVHLATHRDPAWEAEQAARRALAALARDDDTMLALANRILISAPQAGLAAEIDSRIVRPWQAIAAPLAAIPRAGLAPAVLRDLDAATRYATLQAAFWHAYADNLRNDTPATRQAMDRLRQQADTARPAAIGR